MNSFLSIFSDSKSTVSRLVCAGLLVATVGFAPTNAPVLGQDNTAIFSRNAPKENFSDLWISFDFKGGNAIEYVEAIRRAAKNANIVVMPNAKMIDIPPVQLRAVTLASALDFLDNQESTVEGVIYRLVSDRIESGTLPLSDDERQREGVSANHTLPIYVVNVSVKSLHRNFQVPPATGSKVWAVESLIGALSADHLLAAIDVALPLAKEGEVNIEVRFHEETGILIASGESAALAMINQVIEQLQQTVLTREQQESRAKRAAKDQLAQERQEQEYQARMGFDKFRAGVEAELSNLRSATKDERQAWGQESRRNQLELQELQSVIATLRAQLDLRGQQIKQLESELASKKDKE